MEKDKSPYIYLPGNPHQREQAFEVAGQGTDAVKLANRALVVSICVSLDYLATTPNIEPVELEHEAVNLHGNLMAVQKHLAEQGVNNPISLRRYIFEQAERHASVIVGPHGEVHELQIEKIFPKPNDWFSLFAGANKRALDYSRLADWVNKR